MNKQRGHKSNVCRKPKKKKSIRYFVPKNDKRDVYIAGVSSRNGPKDELIDFIVDCGTEHLLNNLSTLNNVKNVPEFQLGVAKNGQSLKIKGGTLDVQAFANGRGGTKKKF